MNIRPFTVVLTGWLGLFTTACGSPVSSGKAGGSGGSSGGSTGGLGNSETGVVTGGASTSTGVVSPTGSSGVVGTGGTSEGGEGSSTGCVFVCETTGEGSSKDDASGKQGQVNDGCEFANGCDKGLVCLDTAEASSACDPAAFGCCQPFCEFPGGGCPNVDQECAQWYDPMDVPQDSPKLKYGVCKIPG